VWLRSELKNLLLEVDAARALLRANVKTRLTGSLQVAQFLCKV